MLTNYLESKLLKHIFGLETYSPSSSFQIGLSKTNPTEAGTGITEPTGNYNRQTITFDYASEGKIKNQTLISFPKATSNWGEIRYAFVVDSSNNVLAYSSLYTIIETGDIFSIPAGGFVLQFDLSFITASFANTLFNFVFKNQSFSSPQLWLALSPEPIVDTIPDYKIQGNYQRQRINSGDVTIADNIVTNTVDFTFGASTQDWGQIYGVGAMDDDDGGSVLIFYNFNSPINMPLGSTLVIPSGQFTVSLD